VHRRIVGLTVFAAVLATCLFGIPLAVAAAHYFRVDEQRELERTADVTAVAVSADLGRARDESNLPAHEQGLQISVYNAAGTRVAGPGPVVAPAAVRGALRGATTSGDLSGRVAAAVPVSDGDAVVGAVLVTADHGQVYARIARAWSAMLALGVAAIGIAWSVARRLSRRIAGPVERLAQTAERLGDGDFNVRTEHAGIAEIDVANTSLDRTAERLGRLLERERAFSADASHQLRTPLTGLQLGLEAALDAPGADLRTALNDALETTRQLEATIADLLALARDKPRTAQPLDVNALMSDVRARWHGQLARADRPLRIEIDRSVPPTNLSRAAAITILDVMLDNALRHGRGSVTVTVRDAGGVVAIDVADEGVIPIASAQLFRRRSAGDATTGIGLALARRLAEAEGGRLVLSAPHPSRFTLLVGPPSSQLDTVDC
jgi:signal transduction histidine kinase